MLTVNNYEIKLRTYERVFLKFVFSFQTEIL